MTGNDVEYTYGTSGNETGRLVHIVDGSGSYECFYDALGNVIEDIRTIALPGSDDVYRFQTKYTYDSWGRMDQMIYPDGEVVSYKYIWGGDLFAMDGDKNGTLQSYIKGIHYNKFGQRDSVQYGNGTRAHYTYDALHRLSRLTSFQLGGAVMQNIKYTFDSVSNITNIKDSVLAIGTLGGGYDNTFNYDGLHRLEGSQGDNTLGHYRYTMDYTPSGRITSKRLRTPSSSLTGSVNMFYGYCNDQKPHTVRRIFDEKNEKHFDLRWDDAGNLGQISIGNEDAKFETGRFLFWTEDNRMHAAVDEKYSSYYVYDHSGERRVKLTGTNDLLDVNADYMYTASVLKEPTIYPSAYMVMSNKGYTKHYYAGAERVAARIGGGGLKVIDQEHGLSDKSGSVFKQSLRQINDRILENNDINCIANGLSSNDKLKIDMNEVPERLQAKLITDYSEFRHTIADAQSIHHNEPDVYFYHSDHLGSASWITDNGGLAVQHLQYLPYGERYVDQRISGYSERFTFTGKERDEETGYGYFGARYMDHELMTMWLSVDPMADKYPNISPYNYCAWNPVRLVDPDGREFGDIYNLRGQHIGSDRRNDNVVYLKSTWSNRQLSTVESNFLIMFGGVKNITEETGLTNDELNLRATLSTIKQAEAGRKNPPLDYNSWNGSDHFTEDSYVDNPKAYARHPGTNPNTKRSASGAYQFLKRFWDSDDFSPQAQDKAAVNLMTKSGYEAALNGDMAGFINSSSKRWTSLSQWEVSDLQDEFYYNRAKELVGKTNIATPIGSLLKKK